MKTAVVIVCFNPCDSFFDDNFNIANAVYIIVDNTVMPQADFIARLTDFKDVIYLPQYNNTGIAKALNIGCQKALDLGYEFVITMDQDSYIGTEQVSQLISYFILYEYDVKMAIVSPLHILKNGVLSSKDFDSNNAVVNSIFTMTSGNLLCLKAWRDIGKFNSDLFIDLVDTDFYVRAMLKGYHVFTLRNVRMRHNLGNLEVKSFLNKKIYIYNHSYIRNYYQVRNALYLVSKYGKLYPRVFKCLFSLVKLFTSVILFEHHKLRKLQYMFLGIWHFIIKRFGKLKNTSID